ncbi:MAG TPA: hypothetical protein VGH06_06080 [Candidatus Udaeobacter sp.]|jgi:hypothetical protein
MKKASIFLVLRLLANCGLTNYIPPVTSQMATAGHGQRMDLATLQEGRTLFAHRASNATRCRCFGITGPKIGRK